MTAPAGHDVLDLGLDWRDSAHFLRDAKPCVLCGQDAHLISHAGEAVHKVCAERWKADHPLDARFLSDPPRRRKASDHA